MGKDVREVENLLCIKGGQNKMENKELKQLAIDIVMNKVFGTFLMKKSDMHNLSVVFMPFIALTEKHRDQMVDDNIVHIYEYYDKAGPISVNRMPCFSSMCLINKTNWEKVVKYIEQYGEKVKSFLGEDE